jgi:hypothetical protein
MSVIDTTTNYLRRSTLSGHDTSHYLLSSTLLVDMSVVGGLVGLRFRRLAGVLVGGLVGVLVWQVVCVLVVGLVGVLDSNI